MSIYTLPDAQSSHLPENGGRLSSVRARSLCVSLDSSSNGVWRKRRPHGPTISAHFLYRPLAFRLTVPTNRNSLPVFPANASSKELECYVPSANGIGNGTHIDPRHDACSGIKKEPTRLRR